MDKYIDLNKIVIPFIFSIFTISVAMLLNIHKHEYIYVVLIGIILYAFLFNLLEKLGGLKAQKYIGVFVVLYLVLVMLPHGHIRDNIKILLYVISTVLMIVSLYQLYTYNISTKQIYKYHSRYINLDNFKPNFIIPFLLMLCFIIIIYPVVLFKFISHNIFISLLFLYVCIFIAGAVFYTMLYKYKYVFDIINYGSSNIIISEICSVSRNKEYMWFNQNIAPYFNNIEYDADNHKIIFKNIDAVNQKDKLEEDKQTLDKSINSMDNFIKQLSDEEIKVTVSNIKDVLVKIDNYHKGEEYKFNKYIQNINEKYMPYIEKLILSYINNKELPYDITKEMQEKILGSLKQIDDVLEKILMKMYNMNMLELESYMDAFDVILSQNGYKDNIKGDK